MKRIVLDSGESMAPSAVLAFATARFLTYGLVIGVPIRMCGLPIGAIVAAVVTALVCSFVDEGVFIVFRWAGFVTKSELPDWLLCRLCGRTHQLVSTSSKQGLTLAEALRCGWMVSSSGYRCPACSRKK